MENGSVIRILDDCASYEIIADNVVMPTSELPSHLMVHNHLIEKGSPYRASLHTHPIELVAMTHIRKFLGKDIALQPVVEHDTRDKGFLSAWFGYHTLRVAK